MSGKSIDSILKKVCQDAVFPLPCEKTSKSRSLCYGIMGLMHGLDRLLNLCCSPSMTWHKHPTTHLTYEGSRLPGDPRSTDKSMVQGVYFHQQEVPGRRQQVSMQQHAHAHGHCCKADKFTALQPVLAAERGERGPTHCHIVYVASTAKVLICFTRQLHDLYDHDHDLQAADVTP